MHAITSFRGRMPSADAGIGLPKPPHAEFLGLRFCLLSLGEVVRHELRWARTIFTVDPVGYIGSGVTHPLPLALVGAALRGFDAWGLAAVLGALTCRLFLKYRLTREFDLPNPNYSLTLARDILSFVVYCASFWSTRVAWRGQDFTVARDGTLVATVEPRVGSASLGKAMR